MKHKLLEVEIKNKKIKKNKRRKTNKLLDKIKLITEPKLERRTQKKLRKKKYKQWRKIMKNFYFTFGEEHKHPKNETPMKDYYVKVMTDTHAAARKIFMEKYGDKFAFQYTDEIMNFKQCSMGCYETIVAREIKL